MDLFVCLNAQLHFTMRDNLPALTFCKVAVGFFLHGDVVLFDLSFG